VSTRVYVPTTLEGLRGMLRTGTVGPAPVVAHAVTEEVRRGLPDAGEEEWEHAASSAAGLACVALLTATAGTAARPRRVVLAVDVASARPAGDEEPTQVELDGTVPFSQVAAVLADAEDAEPAVAAARDALAAGAPEADRLLERCLDHELGWWATQETAELLASADDG
jgi:uncharacterized protein DUF6912